MKKNCTVTCRYGITYDVEFMGTKASIARSCDLMTKCCCWICHNHDCQEPRNEIIENCGLVCELWTNKPYCNDITKL